MLVECVYFGGSLVDLPVCEVEAVELVVEVSEKDAISEGDDGGVVFCLADVFEVLLGVEVEDVLFDFVVVEEEAEI